MRSNIMSNVINYLIDYQLDHILTTILLYLDPASLHAAKQVCRTWHECVCEHIWERKYIRSLVLRTHLKRWKEGAFEERRFQTFSGPDVSIYFLCCAEYSVVASLNNGLTNVFDINNTCIFKFLLNCRKGFDISGDYNYRVRTAIGDDGILCGSLDGGLGVWDKCSYAQVYKEREERISSLKIARSVIPAVFNDKVNVMKLDTTGNKVEIVATLLHGSGDKLWWWSLGPH